MTSLIHHRSNTVAADSFVAREDRLVEPQGVDVRVKVRAVSVNPVDYKIRRYRDPQEGVPTILGWDAVGVIDAVGDEVKDFAVGDRVWYAGDLNRDGSNQAYQLVDSRLIAHAPVSLSDTEAAAVPLVGITAWELLFERLGFQISESRETDTDKTLLVVGAAGGVGSVVVRLAKALTGARVIGTASRAASREAVLAAGADLVIDHSQGLAAAATAAGVDSVTHIAALVGTDQHFTDYPNLLAPYGRLAMIDDPADTPDIRLLKTKSISFHWEMMFTASYFHDSDAMRKQGVLLSRLAELIDAKVLAIPPTTHLGTFSASTLIAAHEALESGRTIGKLVLSMP